MTARSPLLRLGPAAGVVVLTAAAVAVGAASPAAAAPPAAAPPSCTTSWTGGSGAWSAATRWSTGAVPVAGDFVCVLRASGAAVPTVSLTAGAKVRGVTLVGATLRLSAVTAVLTTDSAVVTRSLVAGRGTLLGTPSGALQFLDARLGAGLRARAEGSIFVTGTLTFTGGSRLDQPFPAGTAFFQGDDVTLVDGDHHPGNGVTLGSFDIEVAAGQTVTVQVPSVLRYGLVTVSGTLALPAYRGIDAAGVLQNPDAAFAGFTTWNAGKVVLPRSVTTIGPGTVLDGTAAVVTPAGTDALADLANVSGALSIYRRLALPRALDVTGGVNAYQGMTVDGLTVRGRGQVTARGTTPAVVSPRVQVERKASFTSQSLTGVLESAGRNSLPGGRVGGLRLAPTAVTSLSLSYPATVDTDAVLGGALTVLMPAERHLPADGAQVVLLTAAGGVTGSFASVTTRPARRGTVTLNSTATQVVATFHAPTG